MINIEGESYRSSKLAVIWNHNYQQVTATLKGNAIAMYEIPSAFCLFLFSFFACLLGLGLPRANIMGVGVCHQTRQNGCDMNTKQHCTTNFTKWEQIFFCTHCMAARIKTELKYRRLSNFGWCVLWFSVELIKWLWYEHYNTACHNHLLSSTKNMPFRFRIRATYRTKFCECDFFVTTFW